MATLNSLTHLLINTKQCQPRRFNNGLTPGQQVRTPMTYNTPVSFGVPCPIVRPLFDPVVIGARNTVFLPNPPRFSFYDLNSDVSLPLKLTAKHNGLRFR